MAGSAEGLVGLLADPVEIGARLFLPKAMSGSLEQFDTFARCKHLRVPLGDLFGNPMLAAGMWYYQLMEKLR